MTRYLKTSAKRENKSPPESACVKGYEDVNPIRMVFNNHLERHTSVNPQKFKDPLANQFKTGVREVEYLIRTGRTLQ